jgi:hypothetical protein
MCVFVWINTRASVDNSVDNSPRGSFIMVQQTSGDLSDAPVAAQADHLNSM